MCPRRNCRRFRAPSMLGRRLELAGHLAERRPMIRGLLDHTNADHQVNLLIPSNDGLPCTIAGTQRTRATFVHRRLTKVPISFFTTAHDRGWGQCAPAPLDRSEYVWFCVSARRGVVDHRTRRIRFGSLGARQRRGSVHTGKGFIHRHVKEENHAEASDEIAKSREHKHGTGPDSDYETPIFPQPCGTPCGRAAKLVMF